MDDTGKEGQDDSCSGPTIVLDTIVPCLTDSHVHIGLMVNEEEEGEYNSEDENDDEDDDHDVDDIDHTNLSKEAMCTHSPTRRTRMSDVWSHLKCITKDDLSGVVFWTWSVHTFVSVRSQTTKEILQTDFTIHP